MFSSFFLFLIIITVGGSTHFSKWLQPASNRNVCVCVCMCVCWEGGYLKPYESLPMFSNMRGWTGSRPLPSRPFSLSSDLGAARKKIPFPPFHIFTFFLPSSYSRTSFPSSPPASSLLPFPPYQISCIIADRYRRWGCKMAGGGLYIDVLRFTPGSDKEAMHGRRIQDWRKKTHLKGGGVEKNAQG